MTKRTVAEAELDVDVEENAPVARRPTKAERAAAEKAWRDSRKPDFKKEGTRWTFSDVVRLCALAQLELHKDAEQHWKDQTVRGSWRKIKLIDNKEVFVNHVCTGNTSGIQATAEEKTVSNKKRSTTHKTRGHGQTHWKEAAAIKAVAILLQEHYSNRFIIEPVPDGVGADALIKDTHSTVEGYAAVQFKSAIAHLDERINFKVKKKDGESGGKHQYMVFVAVGLDPSCERPDGVDFDKVSEATITDLFVFADASQMPGKSLQPYPRQIRNEDSFKLNRYSAAVDTEEDLRRLLDLFVQYIALARKFTIAEAWFGTVLNHNIAKNHNVEVENGRVLADLIGLRCLCAPRNQNETIDVVVTINDIISRVSLKTATIDGNGFGFRKSKAPNSQHCDAVMIFYIDRKSKEQTRTHISVISAKDVYDGVDNKFGWSKTNKPQILKNRICLKDKVSAALAIEKALAAYSQRA